MNSESKLLERGEIKGVVEKLQKGGKRVGYTSGSFDLLHAGHIDYLKKAKAQCDCLVVGVNSDLSVQSYKGEKRPIIRERDRALVVSALASVDYVFIFGESNNNQNIKNLKPDIYFKAGDYTKDKLSSASIIEELGGRVVIVPFLPGYSTSEIIENVLNKYNPVNASSMQLAKPEIAPAVFLDRDGTINESVEYLHEPDKFKLLPGVSEALLNLKSAGYRLVIVTNQPGIGLGYFSKEDLFLVHKKFLRSMNENNIQIDKIYFCPHGQAEGCSCRKPKTGMIERAVNELNLDLANSYVVGDMTGDIQLAKNAGCKSILVKTGFSGSDKNYDVAPDFIAETLIEASSIILKERKSRQ